MNAKKLLSLFLILILAFSFAACGQNPSGDGSDSASDPSSDPSEPTAKTEVRVLALSGPTGLGMAKMMEDSSNGSTANAYTFEVFDAPETLLPEVTSGKYDIAALPTNVAAKLYKKTNGQLQILALNTLGVLYVLEIETESVKTVSDLKGKTVYAMGQGSTPEYALKYLLKKNGLDAEKDVNLVFCTTADEVVSHTEAGAVWLLPEPKVTAVKSQVKTARVALNVTEEWDKVCDTPLVQGCVVVRKAFAEANPDAVAAFLSEYEASISYVKDNTADASQLIEKHGLMPKAAVAEKAIPGSNLTFMAGAEMKTVLETFYAVLFDLDATSVGGSLPDSGFYYGK